MKTQLTVATLALLLVVASAANSTNTSNTTSSSSSAVEKLSLYADCKAQNAKGADPCAAINADWCCFYTKTVWSGVTTEDYTCTYTPEYYEKLMASYSASVSTSVDTTSYSSYSISLPADYSFEEYCANSVVLRFAAALFLAVFALAF